VLLAAYFFYRGVVQTRRDGARHLFVLFFLCALYTQMEAALLLPAFGVAWLLWQKPRDWLRPAVWLDVVLLAAGLAVRFYLHGLMVPPGLPGPAEPRPFIAPGGDLLGTLTTLSPFFTSPDRRLATALYTIGLLGLIARFVRRGWPPLRDKEAAATYLSLFLLTVFVGMALFVGESWRRPRYLILILPCFLLIASAVADRGLRRLWTWGQGTWPVLQRGHVAGLGPVLLMTILAAGWGTVMAPWAIDTTRWEDYGYDLAFESVRQAWQTGDAVATIVPAASLFYLDQCDYLAIELGYGGYSREENGRQLETWSYMPILASTADLADALALHPRLWFVIDTMRWTRHFGLEFRALVWERMALVDSQRGVLVFRSGPEVFEAAVHQSNQVDLGPVRLLATDMEAAQVQPGEELRLALRWQAQALLAEDYVVFVHIDDASGQTVKVADGPATGGRYPMYFWEPGELVIDRRAVIVPLDTPPGRYRLTLGLYQPQTGERLPVRGGDPDGRRAFAVFFWVGEKPEESVPGHPLEASFDRQICLQGYDLETGSGSRIILPGESLGVVLHWGACGPVLANYQTFVHLLAADGEIVAQGDGEPLQGQYPTAFWQTGELLRDSYQVPLPVGMAPGWYTLRIGLYRLDTMRRLPLENGDDGIQLATLEVLK
jgi:hypothetical protein